MSEGLTDKLKQCLKYAGNKNKHNIYLGDYKKNLDQERNADQEQREKKIELLKVFQENLFSYK